MPVAASGEITSLEDFVSKLANLGAGLGDPPLWFRGCKDSSYALVPSVFRPSRAGRHEVLMVKRFMQDAYPLLAAAPQSLWEWLFLAQHHGVPTRLLDWSESPLIGLFFAVQSAADTADDIEREGALWLLNPTGLNKTSLNESRLDLPMFGLDESLDDFHPMLAKPTAVHLKPAAGLAARSFLRLSAQWGSFTIHTNAEALDDLAVDTPVLRKFTIPSGAKAQITTDLLTLGIEDRTVYPDLHHLGRSIGQRL